MKKRLDEVLARLVHRAGDVHQAEHHRLGGRHRQAHPVAEAQVDRVEVGDARRGGRAAPRSAPRAPRAPARAPASARPSGSSASSRLELASSAREPAPMATRRPIAPRIERITRQVARRAGARVAGALALHLRRLGELRAHQARQRQVVEEDLHELFLGEVEDEVVLALAGIARLALAAAAARRRPAAARCGRRARTPCCPGWTISRAPPWPWPNDRLADVALRAGGCPRPARCRGCRACRRRACTASRICPW